MQAFPSCGGMTVFQRRIVLSLAVLVAAAIPSFNQESGQAGDLTWKFKKDAKFYQELTTSTDQTMKVQGNDIVQNQKQTFYFSWTPLEVDDKKKEVVLEQKIIGLKMEIDIGGSKIK